MNGIIRLAAIFFTVFAIVLTVLAGSRIYEPPIQRGQFAVGIRTVDFKKFGYSLAGRKRRIESGTKVETVLYGDLTGDNKEEAVVIERFPFRHGERYSSVSIYTMRNNRVFCVPMMEIDGTGPYDCGLSGTDPELEGTGFRGIASASISKGILLLRRYNNSTPGRGVFIETWKFTWDGKRLVPER